MSNSNKVAVAQESSINEGYLAPEARFECPICLAWLRDPLLTSCGHRFCRKCIELWLQRENPCCPVDNMVLTKEDIFPDNFTRREINQQRTKCPNIVRGCFEQLNPLDVDAHLLVCPYKIPELPDNEKLRCSFVHLGCNQKFEDEIELKEHLKEQASKHLEILFEDYKKQTLNNQASTSTAIAQEAHFWDPPSKDGEQPRTNGEADLIRSLYEKIVLLEQKTREQDIIISNMSEQIQSLTLANSKISSRYCNGCFLWHFNDFKSKINSMRKDNSIWHYSPGFYTSPNGYRLCVRLNISPLDPNSIALLIHMMKSEHDNTLDWPFNGKLTITLIHPKNSLINIKETMETEPGLEAFKRPIENRNPKGFGYKEFFSIDEIISKGYLENNELLVKVEVQSIEKDFI